MKQITIEVPEGKKAEWVDGVLKLVDEQPKDVTERIKTFHDAYCELGNEHSFVIAYEQYVNTAGGTEADVIAYLKLRIIAAALNEGWEPQFAENEWRYFPYFVFYTQAEIDEMDEEKKRRVVFRSSSNANAFGGVAYADTYYDSSYTLASIGSRLAFKTRELAKYAGEQFIDIWAGYIFKAD